VQDVQDLSHITTLCTAPIGARRFITATTISIEFVRDVSKFDLITGATQKVMTHSADPVVGHDWSFDGGLYVYAQGTTRVPPLRSTISLHLVSQGTDRTLTTFDLASAQGLGDVAVEFSPDGQFLAFGAPGSVNAGEQASVQVRSLDGSLVFSSAGTGRLTWAGGPTKLYFQGDASLESWESGKGLTSLPERAWLFPHRSSDGTWLAYVTPDYSTVRLIDTRTGRDIAVGPAGGGRSVGWISATVLVYEKEVQCVASATPSTSGSNCGAIPGVTCVYQDAPCSKTVAYNIADGRESDWNQWTFGSWPRGTP
jgi:hypothetical protein